MAPQKTTQFDHDFSKLQQNAEAYHRAEKEIKKEEAAVVKEVDSLAHRYKGNPNELLAILIVKVLGSKTDNCYQLRLKQEAEAVNIQNDLAGLSNDVQGKINAKSANPNDVKIVAEETDKMQDVLGGRCYNSSVAKWKGYVHSALGKAGAEPLDENFKAVRDEIYWKKDPESEYNPSEAKDAPNPKKPSEYTYHFYVGSDAKDEKAYMTNFKQMNDNLGKQGNPFGAQDANKTFTDKYDQTAASLQAFGQAANAKINVITSNEKLTTNAVTGFTENVLRLNSAAVKNQRAS